MKMLLMRICNKDLYIKIENLNKSIKDSKFSTQTRY